MLPRLADHVTVVEGFFAGTLTRPERIPLEAVAIAWVDCDLYASTVPALSPFCPKGVTTSLQ